MQNRIVPWSDNWWIDKSKAWFCAGERSVLYCVDMNSQECELVARIPNGNLINFRLNSYCIKYKDEIFCLPVEGNSIFCYNLKIKQWKKIDTNCKQSLWVSIATYIPNSDTLWIVEDETGKIFKLSLEKKVIEREFQISCKQGAVTGEYTMVGNELYGVIGNSVYNICNDNVKKYSIPETKTNLHTICYDGNNFWLSGFCKEIYVWNPKQGLIKTISEFPKQFGFYDFVQDESPIVDCDSFFSIECAFFIESVFLGEYIWFIPCRSDEIVYINIETYEIHLLQVEGEKETKESIENHILDHKYLIQYIREKRYIGIYSLRNGYIFEVDTVDLCVKRQNYILDANVASRMAGIIMTEQNKETKFFEEKNEQDRELITMVLLGDNNEYMKGSSQKIGESIYFKLCNCEAH